MNSLRVAALLVLVHCAAAFAVPLKRGRPGTQVWKYTADGPIAGMPAIDDDGSVYFTASVSTLHALDHLGRHRWMVANAGYSSPTIGDRAVYVTGGPWSPDGSIRGRISAYNFRGSPEWSLPTAYSPTTSASLARDNTLYVGSNEGALMAVNREGIFQWIAGGGDWIVGEAAVGRDGTIYFSNGADAPYAHAVNPLGETIWDAPAPAEFPSPFSIGDDGALYFGVTYELRALNPDGTLRWTFPLESFDQSSPMIGRDGTIYVVSGGKVLHALTSAGEAKWTFTYTNAGGEVASISTPALGGDGAIYLTTGQQLLALKSDATVAWSFTAEANVTTSPILSPDGIIYFADAGNNIYAVYGSAPPAANGWPMFRHDAKGTSNAGQPRR